MWSWTSFLVGLMLGTPMALLVLALCKAQPMQCHCCPKDAVEELEMSQDEPK